MSNSVKFNTPWDSFPEKTTASIIDADNNMICEVYADSHEDVVKLADAISALPELLEACKRVLRSIDWATTEDRLSAIQEAQVLRDAIAKAEGRS